MYTTNKVLYYFISLFLAGNLFHIDFGYILGRDPKPFPPPMKLSKEMVRNFFPKGFHHRTLLNASLGSRTIKKLKISGTIYCTMTLKGLSQETNLKTSGIVQFSEKWFLSAEFYKVFFSSDLLPTHTLNKKTFT